jgi:hypothetical protein
VFWDDLVRRWRRDSRSRDPKVLRAIGGHVAVFPAPQRARQSRSLLLILLVLAAVAALALVSNRPGDTGASGPPPASTGFVGSRA